MSIVHSTRELESKKRGDTHTLPVRPCPSTLRLTGVWHLGVCSRAHSPHPPRPSQLSQILDNNHPVISGKLNSTLDTADSKDSEDPEVPLTDIYIREDSNDHWKNGHLLTV